MSDGIFAQQLKGQPRSVAVIGAGASGSIASVLLSKLGFDVTVLEAGDSIFDAKSSSQNNTGIIHHIIFGGDPEVQTQLFKAGMLYTELFPRHLFSDQHMLYLAPGTVGERGQRNSAVEGTRTMPQGEADISLAGTLATLKRDYEYYCNKTGTKPYGSVGKICHMVGEDELTKNLGFRPDGKPWMDAQDPHRFAVAAKVHQSVINLSRFKHHMQGVSDELQHKPENDFHIHTASPVAKVEKSATGAGFTVSFKPEVHTSATHFDHVVNAAYSRGLEIEAGAEKNACHVKHRMFGLFKVPPELAEQFRVSRFMGRDFDLGEVIRVGPGLVAVVSGKQYNRDEVNFSAGTAERHLPAHWHSNSTAESVKKTKDAPKSERELLAEIQSDVAKWFPDVKQLIPVKLMRGQHLYPPGRATADAVQAASGRKNPILESEHNPRGGEYLFLSGAKLTTAPHDAVECALRLLKPYIESGVLTQQEVDKQLRIDPDGYAVLSAELKVVFAKDTPVPDVGVVPVERQRGAAL